MIKTTDIYSVTDVETRKSEIKVLLEASFLLEASEEAGFMPLTWVPIPVMLGIPGLQLHPPASSHALPPQVSVSVCPPLLPSTLRLPLPFLPHWVSIAARGAFSSWQRAGATL